MDAYDNLRRAARDDRDDAIKDARHEYREPPKSIKDLKANINGVPINQGHSTRHSGPNRRASIDVICSVMPEGREFTAEEMRELVQAEEPDRKIHRNTVRILMHTLKDEGVCRRVRREGKNVVWWEKLRNRWD